MAAGVSVGDAAGSIAAIRFGSERRFWRMTPVAEFPGHLSAVPFLQDRLRIALAEGVAGELHPSGRPRQAAAI